jgi:hypothetical protein
LLMLMLMLMLLLFCATARPAVASYQTVANCVRGINS